MARLPEPGGDADKWAHLLNEYLLVAHNSDGTARADSFAALTATVGLNDLRVLNPPSQNLKSLLLSNDGTNLVWKQTIEINVRNYGAVGDGVTDDTDAIQAAINDTSDGGAVVFPRGVFMVRTLKIVNKGTSLIGNGRWATRILRINESTDPVIDMSGTGTGIGHTRYDSIQEMTISGNGLPGTLLRAYYADNCIFRAVSFIHCPGKAADFVEVWDSRFEDCSWEDCGTLDAPAMLFRNSTAPGTFGYSTDNTNQIHFTSCRWEAFQNGAIRLEGAANGSTSLLNGFFLVACKMETSLAAGPAVQIMAGTTIVFVDQLYLAMLKFASGYTTPLDAIASYGSYVFMSNVYVQWGVDTGLANATVHMLNGGPQMCHELSAYYPTEPPAIATLVVEDGVDAMSSCITVNRGLILSGDMTKMLESDPMFGFSMNLKSTASFKLISEVTGRDLVKADNSPVRPTLQTLNGTDLAGFSGDYTGEKWRFYGDTGFVRLASGGFQIEGTKGYVGIGTAPYTNIAFLIKMANDTDRGLAIIRKSATATGRLVEFQDENFNIQGIAIDAYGRPISVGRVANVAAGDQVAYANVRIQARDIGGSVSAAMKTTPAPGSIAMITFFKPYPSVPQAITLTDHSAVEASLYVSARSNTGFTVSTRKTLQGGSIVNFDYVVTGSG